MTDCRIGIVRTLPAFKGRQEVCETEKLYCDAIAAAKEFIYIENQYLSSVAVARALQKKLQQEKGPEIVLVLPRESSGWLEQSTMDAIRAHILTRLDRADRNNRLRVLYPALADGKKSVYVHAKIMEEDSQSGEFHLLKISAAMLVLLALAAAWRWTPLSQWVTLETLTKLAENLRGSPLLPFGVLGAFVAGRLTMVPVTVLIGATAIIFPAHLGVMVALAGCLLNSLVTYLIGAGLGRRTVRKLAGSKLNRLSKRLARQGILTVAVVRNIPVAPFAVVNMVAGASHIRLKDFLLGTALGMLPGIVAITVFADRVTAALKHPDWTNIAVAAGIALVLALGGWLTQKRLQSRDWNKKNTK